ncbi:hypothetical protein CLV62_14126 [Dysgonomonas alginatilytica]|uniref:C1q domain-containing protein n=1 Tax=Dysgonomonas alginatilytica TaxID=1605892 RepID=A0A2V3PI09_9BACT|nr:hypothetical protein [Dysgonomonas alginatilytica]PXV58915.1 hypothetical protein CLV62_14126 [Dysgonomonas alginatilytica]
MKKRIQLRNKLLWLFSLSSVLVQAQVGINTKNPQGIFHIDPLSNTTSSTGFLDDFMVVDDGKGGVGVGLGAIPSANASLSMNDPNQGFLPNRVELTSVTDKATVPNPVSGMLVYNTGRSGVFPNNTIPGIYIYNGTKWLRMQTNSYTGLREKILMKTDLTLQAANATSALETSTLDFGAITIKEDGGYAFSLNLDMTAISGTSELGGNTSNSILRPQIYLFIYKKQLGETVFTKVDVAELNTPIYKGTTRVTASIVLGCTAYAGDQIQIRVGCTTAYTTGKLNKTYTYTSYWKV